MSFNLRALLEEMIEKEASDLHITTGERPKLRIDGDITDSSVTEVLTPKDTLQDVSPDTPHPSADAVKPDSTSVCPSRGVWA